MTLTKTDLRNAVKAYKEENARLGRRQSLYAGQRSELFQMILDDLEASETKKPVSSNRRGKDVRPSFCSPCTFNTQGNRKVQVLWPCEMVELSSSFISRIGYNKEARVLKIEMGKYIYAYQDVPFSVFNTFKYTNSPGKFYARIRSNYACVGLV